MRNFFYESLLNHPAARRPKAPLSISILLILFSIAATTAAWLLAVNGLQPEPDYRQLIPAALLFIIAIVLAAFPLRWLDHAAANFLLRRLKPPASRNANSLSQEISNN